MNIEDDFEYWVDSLFEDGYDLSNYTWEGLFEYFCENVLSEAENDFDRPLDPNLFKGKFKINPNLLNRSSSSYSPSSTNFNFNKPIDGRNYTQRGPIRTTLATSGYRPGSVSTLSGRPFGEFKEKPFTPAERSRIINQGSKDYAKQSQAARAKGASTETIQKAEQTGKTVWTAANPTLASRLNPDGTQKGPSPNPQRPNSMMSQAAELRRAREALVSSRTPKESFDFSSPSKVASDMAYLYQSIYEGKKKVDQDMDGDNDFADVMIARMVAAGVPRAEAIRRVRNKEYNV